MFRIERKGPLRVKTLEFNRRDQMHFTALPTETVRSLQQGGMDANGQAAEHCISDGQGTPCRHCLRDVPEGAGMLILAYRPFEHLHAYAETGPIFLCAEGCPRGGGAEVPHILTTSPDYLVKGYCADERIVYDTGGIVLAQDIIPHAARIFQDPKVAYAHVRSARNNCYQLRIDRD